MKYFLGRLLVDIRGFCGNRRSSNVRSEMKLVRAYLLCLKYSTWRGRLAAAPRVLYGRPSFFPFSAKTLWPSFTFLITIVPSTVNYPHHCYVINTVCAVGRRG